MQVLPSSGHHRKNNSTARLTPLPSFAAYQYQGHVDLSHNGSCDYWPTQDQNQQESPTSVEISPP